MSSLERTARHHGVELTPELLALFDCEKAIEQGVSSVGFSLRRVRDKRLFTAAGFDTFESYCRGRWGWAANYGNRLIEHTVTVEAIEAASDERANLARNEGTVRPLAALDVEDRAEAWQEAVDLAAERGKSKPTAAIVTEVVDRRLGRVRQRDDHPAIFSKAIIDACVELVGHPTLILDPFAGTGLVHQIADRVEADSIGVEIEPEWADMHERTICADARTIDRLLVGHPDAVVTSPTYGNRMADHHDATDGSDRATYKHRLGRELTEGNSGGMPFGPEYRELHHQVYDRVIQTLVPGGVFILNVKDHVRDGDLVQVAAWHVGKLLDLGLAFDAELIIPTRGLAGAGDNADARAGFERVYRLLAP